jgi:hypothetical protein
MREEERLALVGSDGDARKKEPMKKDTVMPRALGI